MVSPSNKKKYFVRILVLVLVLILIVSVALNLYDHFVTFPQMQRDTNIMRTKALEGWLHEMLVLDISLQAAETNYDIEQANRPFAYERFAAILQEDSSENLYSSIGEATFWLNEGLQAMFFGSIPGPVTERSLNQTEQSMIANLTDSLDDLLIKSAQPKAYHLVDLLDYSRDMVGKDPAQQLQEAGVNMTDVSTYLDQLTESSKQIVYVYPS